MSWRCVCAYWDITTINSHTQNKNKHSGHRTVNGFCYSKQTGFYRIMGTSWEHFSIYSNYHVLWISSEIHRVGLFCCFHFTHVDSKIPNFINNISFHLTYLILILSKPYISVSWCLQSLYANLYSHTHTNSSYLTGFLPDVEGAYYICLRDSGACAIG